MRSLSAVIRVTHVRKTLYKDLRLKKPAEI